VDVLDDDWRLVGNKTSVTRLGFSVLLEYFELEARFPRHAGEVPQAAVRYVAAQVKVDPALFRQYPWSGSTIEYHRAQIRAALGFREPTRADEERLTAWLAAEICPTEMAEEGLKSSLWARCRVERIEPPGRIDRILGSARTRFEQQFCAQIRGRLPAEAITRLEELITGSDTADVSGGRGFFAELKADPGRLGLETLLEEIAKLSRVREIGLNHPGFGRDSLLGSGDQADQVAQLVQGLELDRWPALAGSVQSTVVVPIHPCRSGDVDLSYIVPWPAWFNQLGLVQTYQ
jgi:Domain of unknown function (DUF4158)